MSSWSGRQKGMICGSSRRKNIVICCCHKWSVVLLQQDYSDLLWPADFRQTAKQWSNIRWCVAKPKIIISLVSIYPNSRNAAISYARLMLNDTTLREHQYRMGLADLKSCEADDGIEDAYHFFFECVRYSDNRDKLKQDIQRSLLGQILEEADHLVGPLHFCLLRPP